jgi:hypothetical protein
MFSSAVTKVSKNRQVRRAMGRRSRRLSAVTGARL